MRLQYLAISLACAASFAAAGQRARNVILFVGDAGGIPVLSAASAHGYHEPRKLFVQHMPHIGLLETSSANSWVTDSAAGMTAIVTGNKTNSGVLSMSPATEAGKQDGEKLKTILEYAEERGLSTGLISNSPMYDATPAACYAHSASRGKTGEIFSQVWKPRFGDGVDVIIGPGRTKLAAALTGMGLDLEKGLRGAGLPLYGSVAEVPADARRAVVLFDDSEYDLGGAVERAVAMLSKNRKGFFLMVECDLHTSNPRRGLDRAVAFDRLIAKMAGKASRDTLLLFTADHSYDFRLRSGKKGAGPTMPESNRAVPGAPRTDVAVGSSHTGEEVMVAGQGPGSERVNGVMANTDLFGIMMAAWGVEAVGKGSSPGRKDKTPHTYGGGVFYLFR